MSAAVTKIVGGFTELGITPPSLTADDSMSDIARKVNAAFDAILDSAQHITDQDSMSIIADKIDANFQAAESASPAVQTFSFLHASDPHSKTAAVVKMAQLLDSDADDSEFGIITGDFKTGTTSGLDSYYKEANGTPSGYLNGYRNKIFALAGNHDALDSWDGTVNYNNKKMTDWMYLFMGESVNWGDIQGAVNQPLVSSYYYKDFNVNGDHPVRLIVLDQYEIVYTKGEATSSSYMSPHSYPIAYTNKQMQWFIDTLKATPANYTIIIGLHEVPYKKSDSALVSALDPNAAGNADKRNNELLFVSEGGVPSGQSTNRVYSQMFTEMNYTSHGTMLCDIVQAFMDKDSFSHTYNNYTGNLDGQLVVNADFSNMAHEPATFACYVFGHLHHDLCFAPPSYPKQLMLSIARADYNVERTTYDDLLVDSTRHYNYRINKVTIEFANENTPMCVHVERVGEQSTKYLQRTRDELFFYFDSERTISHERISNWVQ